MCVLLPIVSFVISRVFIFSLCVFIKLFYYISFNRDHNTLISKETIQNKTGNVVKSNPTSIKFEFPIDIFFFGDVVV